MKSLHFRKHAWLFFIAVYIVVYYLLLRYKGDESLGLIGGNILSALAAFISSLMLFYTQRSSKNSERVFWFLLFSGSLSYVVAEILWIYYENILKAEVPFPGYTDLFYMLQIVFYFLGLVFLLSKIKRPIKAVRYIFDASIIITVASTFSWYFLIKPILSYPSASGLFLFFSIGYPVGDLALIFGAFAIYAGTGKAFFQKGLHFFVTGVFIQIIADSAYLFLLASDSYTTGNLIDPLFAMALLMVGVAGLYNRGEKFQLTAGGEVTKPGKSLLFRMYLPYISIFVLFLFLFTNDIDDSIFTIGSGIAIMLVIVRQLLILDDNRRLLVQYQERTIELAVNEQRYRSLFDFHSDAVFSLDLNGHFTSVNSSCRGLIGYDGDLVGTSIFSIVEKNKAAPLSEYLEKTREGEPQQFEISIQGQEGRIHCVSFTTIPMIVSQKVVGVYGIGRDITESKENEEKVTYMAYHDLLTGLPNRSLFEKLLTKAISDPEEKGQLHAVIFIDLDRFKVINDSLGHQVGDQLLNAVAERLEKVLRMNDIVARQGGDEFTLLAKGIASLEVAAGIAEDIISRLGESFLINGNDLRITTSIGIAMYPDDGVTAVELMKNADMAMYKAKENGKNGYCFYGIEMNEEPSRKLILEKDLHVAVENGQLTLHFQPQFDTRTNEIIGAEALVRWIHPTLGFVSPAEFIPIAEQSGLIVEIGEWILRSACEQGRKWLGQGYGLKIGVNLSPRQFYQENLLEMVEGILMETDLPPENLDLEITEGIAMNDLNLVVPTLFKLRRLGIKISIDDFGTGYSSLSYLSSIPIDTLKIAREFVDKIGVDKGNEAIIASIIAMTKNLHLEVIAEGVETEKQSLFLQNLDCRLMQGYWYGKPMPVMEMNEVLAEKIIRNV